MSEDGANGRSRGDAAFAAFERVEIKLDHIRSMLTAAGFSAVAPEEDARGQYGDVKIKFAPKAWRGPTYKGSTASQCSSAFLSLYAAAIEQMALRTLSKPAERDAPEKLKYARYDLRDAALCRRWAMINKDKPAEVPAATPTPRSADGGQQWVDKQDDGDPWGSDGSSDDGGWDS